MSRTYRRSTPQLIRLYVGSIEDSSRCWRRQFRPDLTDEQFFARQKAKALGDNHVGLHSVPGWFSHLTSTIPHRRYERREIHRCLQQDDWDDHLPIRRYRRPWWW